MTRKTALLGAAITLLGVAGSANALVLTYDDLITGSVPASPTPWLTDTITNLADNVGVQMKIDAGVVSPEFITSIFFSLGASANLSKLSDPATTPDISLDGCSGDAPAGTGPWQLCMSFAPNLHVRSPTSITFNLLGLHESDFVANSAGWLSAAHIQGVLPCSAWVGAYGGTGSPPTPGQCGTTSVPEPSTWTLLGLGVIAMLGSAVTRRRASIRPSI